MDSKPIEKKTERITKIQKQKLVDYMSANLEFARGQFSGTNSNINHKQKWESLKVTLNSLGGSEKSLEQWKKCWLDLKCGVKKSINARRKIMNKTGGGSWSEVPRDLNAMEEQILRIISTDAVDGDSCTQETGVASKECDEVFSCEEHLEYDEVHTPPAKKLKTMPSTSSAPANKNYPNASKYADAIQEARNMQAILLTKLEVIENQNKLILEKLDRILENK